jgi:hypothetical protein
LLSFCNFLGEALTIHSLMLLMGSLLIILS